MCIYIYIERERAPQEAAFGKRVFYRRATDTLSNHKTACCCLTK